MYCVFLGRALQTVNAPNASVGTAQLADDAVTSVKIPDSNITTAKIANNAITNAKLDISCVNTSNIGNGQVRTANIQDLSVTVNKLSSTIATKLNFITVTANSDLDQINTNKNDISNNSATITTLTNGAPSVLNTLNKLAGALGNDANFSTTVTTALSNRVQTTGDETIAGNKTFSSTITGNINGEAATTNKIKYTSTAPDSNTSGTAGEIRYDSNFLYICTGTGTGLWKKVALQNIA